MPGFVRDIFERDAKKQFVTSGTGVADISWGDRRHAAKRSTEWCLRASEILRKNGRPGARAADASGCVIPVAGLDKTPTEKVYQSATDLDGIARQCPRTRRATNGYYVDLHVFFQGTWRNESVGPGRTPNEALARLFSDDRALVREYVKTLPIADVPAEIQAAPVDLSTATPMSLKEYNSYPASAFRAGGKYFTDPLFKRRVDLLRQQQQHDETVRRAEFERDL